MVSAACLERPSSISNTQFWGKLLVAAMLVFISGELQLQLLDSGPTSMCGSYRPQRRSLMSMAWQVRRPAPVVALVSPKLGVVPTGTDQVRLPCLARS